MNEGKRSEGIVPGLDTWNHCNASCGSKLGNGRKKTRCTSNVEKL